MKIFFSFLSSLLISIILQTNGFPVCLDTQQDISDYVNKNLAVFEEDLSCSRFVESQFCTSRQGISIMTKYCPATIRAISERPVVKYSNPTSFEGCELIIESLVNANSLEIEKFDQNKPLVEQLDLKAIREQMKPLVDQFVSGASSFIMTWSLVKFFMAGQIPPEYADMDMLPYLKEFWQFINLLETLYNKYNIKLNYQKVAAAFFYGIIDNGHPSPLSSVSIGNLMKTWGRIWPDFRNDYYATFIKGRSSLPLKANVSIVLNFYERLINRCGLNVSYLTSLVVIAKEYNMIKVLESLSSFYDELLCPEMKKNRYLFRDLQCRDLVSKLDQSITEDDPKGAIEEVRKSLKACQSVVSLQDCYLTDNNFALMYLCPEEYLSKCGRFELEGLDGTYDKLKSNTHPFDDEGFNKWLAYHFWKEEYATLDSCLTGCQNCRFELQSTLKLTLKKNESLVVLVDKLPEIVLDLDTATANNLSADADAIFEQQKLSIEVATIEDFLKLDWLIEQEDDCSKLIEKGFCSFHLGEYYPVAEFCSYSLLLFSLAENEMNSHVNNNVFLTCWNLKKFLIGEQPFTSEKPIAEQLINSPDTFQAMLKVVTDYSGYHHMDWDEFLHFVEHSSPPEWDIQIDSTIASLRLFLSNVVLLKDDNEVLDSLVDIVTTLVPDKTWLDSDLKFYTFPRNLLDKISEHLPARLKTASRYLAETFVDKDATLLSNLRKLMELLKIVVCPSDSEASISCSLKDIKTILLYWAEPGVVNAAYEKFANLFDDRLPCFMNMDPRRSGQADCINVPVDSNALKTSDRPKLLYKNIAPNLKTCDAVVRFIGCFPRENYSHIIYFCPNEWLTHCHGETFTPVAQDSITTYIHKVKNNQLYSDLLNCRKNRDAPECNYVVNKRMQILTKPAFEQLINNFEHQQSITTSLTAPPMTTTRTTTTTTKPSRPVVSKLRFEIPDDATKNACVNTPLLNLNMFLQKGCFNVHNNENTCKSLLYNDVCSTQPKFLQTYCWPELETNRHEMYAMGISKSSSSFQINMCNSIRPYVEGPNGLTLENRTTNLRLSEIRDILERLSGSQNIITPEIVKLIFSQKNENSVSNDDTFKINKSLVEFPSLLLNWLVTNNVSTTAELTAIALNPSPTMTNDDGSITNPALEIVQQRDISRIAFAIKGIFGNSGSEKTAFDSHANAMDNIDVNDYAQLLKVNQQKVISKLRSLVNDNSSAAYKFISLLKVMFCLNEDWAACQDLDVFYDLAAEVMNGNHVLYMTVNIIQSTLTNYCSLLTKPALLPLLDCVDLTVDQTKKPSEIEQDFSDVLVEQFLKSCDQLLDLFGCHLNKQKFFVAYYCPHEYMERCNEVIQKPTTYKTSTYDISNYKAALKECKDSGCEVCRLQPNSAFYTIDLIPSSIIIEEKTTAVDQKSDDNLLQNNMNIAKSILDLLQDSRAVGDLFYQSAASGLNLQIFTLLVLGSSMFMIQFN